MKCNLIEQPNVFCLGLSLNFDLRVTLEYHCGVSATGLMGGRRRNRVTGPGQWLSSDVWILRVEIT
jgi:hypothetical protein